MDDWDKQWIFFGLLFIGLIGWICSIVPLTVYFGTWVFIPWISILFLWPFIYDHVFCNNMILNSFKKQEDE